MSAIFESTATSERERSLLQDLADAAAAALEHAEVRADLERRVAEGNELLAQVHSELEAFSFAVAHDLRSPLGAILGFAELLEDRLPSTVDADIRLFAAEITLAGKRMNGLIGALLSFSRSASAAIERTCVDLSSHARVVADRLLREAGSAAELHIEPGLHVHADAALLDSVLTHLLSNALKYASHQARPCIELGVLRPVAEMPLRSTTFFVRDNGLGFDPKHSEQLFVPFKRAHVSRELDGSGVGLATVARIVRRHGGRVWAEGRPDHGATFYVSLPNEE